MRDFTAAHNDYLDPDRHLNLEEDFEPFVEPDTTTEEQRAAEREYLRKITDIELAVERQIAEREANSHEVCPRCGAEMEWAEGDSDVGQGDYWHCPECENWEVPGFRGGEVAVWSGEVAA